jgi:DNA-binding SARP family transcriptional activator
MVDYRVLGPLEVHDASGPLPLPAGHPRRVLAVLLLDAGRPVSAEVLIDRLWGTDAPATARAALQVHVSKLRRHLGGGGAIRTTSAGYVLDVGPDELDACAFERAVHEAQQCAASDPTRALELLDVADRLWRGVPYTEVADEPWVEPEVARLTELRLAAEEARAETGCARRPRRSPCASVVGSS